MPLNFPYTNPKVEKYVLLLASQMRGGKTYKKLTPRTPMFSESGNRVKEDPRERRVLN